MSVKSLKTKDKVSNIKEAREKWHIAYILERQYSGIWMTNFLNIQKNEARGSEKIFLNDEKVNLMCKSGKHILWK